MPIFLAITVYSQSGEGGIIGEIFRRIGTSDKLVRFALRMSAREIGWRAYAIGGLAFMHRVFDLAEIAGGSGAVLDK